MLIKILNLIFLLHVSFEQTRPQIKILSVEDTKCSDTLGKVEYKAKFTCSPYQEIDSYFMLYYKDSSNRKRPSICKISKLGKSDDVSPGEKETTISSNEIPTTIPDLPPKPTSSETNQVIDSDTASEESDQKTDEGSDDETNSSKEEKSDQTDETTDDKSEEPTESPTNFPINGTDDDNLELYLSLLRGKIEDSLGNASITGENLYNLSLDLKVIYDYKVKNQFNAKNVYVPLDKSINILLQKIKEFDYNKIYDRINETVCSFKQHFLYHINKRMSILGFGQNVLKNQIDALKDNIEDKLNSSLLNDLISKYSDYKINLSEIPNLEDSELGQKILNFTRKNKRFKKKWKFRIASKNR